MMLSSSDIVEGWRKAMNLEFTRRTNIIFQEVYSNIKKLKIILFLNFQLLWKLQGGKFSLWEEFDLKYRERHYVPKLLLLPIELLNELTRASDQFPRKRLSDKVSLSYLDSD